MNTSPQRAAVHGEMTIELVLHGLRERCSCLHKVSVVSSGICGPGMGAFSGEPEDGAAAWYFAYPNYLLVCEYIYKLFGAETQRDRSRE
jgi:hypothetical protein